MPDSGADLNVSGVGQGRDLILGIEGRQCAEQSFGLASAGGVVLAARPDAGYPDRESVGVGEHLDVPAVVFVLARPPQVCIVRPDSCDMVGVDQGAVQVEVTVAASPSGRQRFVTCRCRKSLASWRPRVLSANQRRTAVNRTGSSATLATRNPWL